MSTKIRRKQSHLPLIHGPVQILNGTHRGALGIYDDDKDSRYAIVYIKPETFVSEDFYEWPYAVVNKASLVNVTTEKELH